MLPVRRYGHDSRGESAAEYDVSLVASAVEGSRLVDGDPADAPLSDRFRHRFGSATSHQAREDLDVYLQCALSNSESDLRLRSMDLVRPRDDEARGYLEALKRRDASGAQCWCFAVERPIDSLILSATMLQLSTFAARWIVTGRPPLRDSFICSSALSGILIRRRLRLFSPDVQP